MAVESLQSSPSLSEKEMERFTELVLKHPEALGLFPSVTSNGDVYEPLEYLDLTSDSIAPLSHLPSKKPSSNITSLSPQTRYLPSCILRS
ncbi:hypothetical protein BT69DRAFT_529906 [Atractiella rhizophila]|nr:hypothetical protein BT69DRAFT_529906 [Atractiella rhizophila]